MKVIDWLNEKDVKVLEGCGDLYFYAYLRDPLDLLVYTEEPLDKEYQSENLQDFVRDLIDRKFVRMQNLDEFMKWDVVQRSPSWVFFKRREPSGKVTAVIECFAIPYRNR